MKRFIAFVSTLMLPFAAFAQATGVAGLIGRFADVLKLLFPIAVALAVLALFYEIVMFIFNKDEPDKSEKFKKGILWSLAALLVMLTFFGIIRLVAQTLGVGDVIGAGLDSTNIPTVHI